MTPSDILPLLRRRWRLLVGSFLVYALVTIGVTLALPRTYQASATIYVGASSTTSSPDQLVRTYAALAPNPNIAEAVGRELPFRLTRSALLNRMTFAPVNGTQLLEITGSASSGEEARTLANTYATVFVQRVADLAAAGAVRDRVAVSESAALPNSPSKPNRPVFIGLGLLLSAILAGALVAVREARNPTLALSSQDESLLGLPILGRIPKIRRRRDGGGDPVDDAFQWLRTSLHAARPGPGPVLVVTSPSPGDGKSTVVAHLARAMAAAGQSVVVVEADLRRPGLERTLLGDGLERDEIGLVDELRGARTVEPADHPELPGVHVVWAGAAADHPATLLELGLDGLLDRLRAGFQHVLVDTPPLSVGADAAIAAGAADGVLLVVDLEHSPAAAIRRALNRLRQVDAPVAGVLLNRAKVESLDDYHREASKRAAGSPER